MILISLLIFSFLPLFNWTLGAQSSAPRVSASVSISFWMEGSMVIFKIIISLITGQVSQDEASSLLLFRVLAGIILVDFWNSSRA